MNQVILAPILLYFILYGLLSWPSLNLYESMHMSQLISETNRLRLPELQKTNTLIFVIVLSIFIDSFIKTILIVRLSAHIAKPHMDVLKNFPYGLIVFLIGMTLLIMHDQTDPADMITIGLFIFLMFLFCLITVTFYIVLFTQDIVRPLATASKEDLNQYPMPIFQMMITLCAGIFVLFIYRTILTGDTITLPLAGLFLYILVGTLLVSNIMTFIMVTKLQWNSELTMQMFQLPNYTIGLITFGIILLTYFGSYPEWILYPTPILFLYWIITAFAGPSNYAIMKSIAMKWSAV